MATHNMAQHFIQQQRQQYQQHQPQPQQQPQPCQNWTCVNPSAPQQQQELQPFWDIDVAESRRLPDTNSSTPSPSEDAASGTPTTMDMMFASVPTFPELAPPPLPSAPASPVPPVQQLQYFGFPLPPLDHNVRLQQRLEEQKTARHGGRECRKRLAIEPPQWQPEEDAAGVMDVSPLPQEPASQRRPRRRRRRTDSSDEDHLSVFYKKPEKPRAVLSQALLARADATYATWLAACDTPSYLRPVTCMRVPSGHVRRPGAWLAYLWCLQAQLCHASWATRMLKVVCAFPWAFDAAVADVDFATDSIGPSRLAIASEAYDAVRGACAKSSSIHRQLKRKFYSVQSSTHARGNEWLCLAPASDHEQRWQRKVVKLRETAMHSSQ